MPGEVAYLPARPEADAFYSPGEVAYLPVPVRFGLGAIGDEGQQWRAPPRGGTCAAAPSCDGGSTCCPGGETDTDTEAGAKETDAKAMAVIKNLPSRCSEEDVVGLIDKLGFRSDVIEFSMPTRVGKGKRKVNRGFAFVNFSDVEVCRKFVEASSGHRGFGDHLSSRAISVVFSLRVGGGLREGCPRRRAR